jgi:crotonobetainyl-CoA:carnitine CoA-transferase CaiB-like acyl-CoA transferase
VIKETFRQYSKQDLMAKLETTGLPFAPIARPEELFEDPHLAASGGLLPLTVADGKRQGEATQLPALPMEMDGQRFGVRLDVPRAGEHTREVLAHAGYSGEEIDALISEGVVSAQ